MLKTATGVLSGSVMVLQLTELPNFLLSLSILLLAVCFLVYFTNQKRNNLAFLLAVVVGFSITSTVADYHQANSFPTQLEGKDLVVHGQIKSLVKINDYSRSFLFDVTSARLADEGEIIDWHGLIRLSVYNRQPKVKAGERWQFKVRLKPGSGFKNPVGFDYEKWLFSQRIEANGYLRKPKHELLASAPWHSVDSIREVIHQKIKTSLLADSDQALVSALILAEKTDVSKVQWDTLRATGTSHLMAISGLHIGLVASGGFLLVWLIWYCFPTLNLYVPARVAGSALGMVLAVAYALLAGMTIPTQRALLMVVLGLFMLANKQYYSGFRVVAFAMILILLFDPLAVMSVGFYLSFSAVFVILWLLKRVAKSGRLALLNLQLLLSLLMVPLSLLFFGQGSLVSPLANLIAIPWVSFIIVPLSMMSVIFSFISENLAAYLFQFLSLHLEGLLTVLSFLANVPAATFESFHLPSLLISAIVVAGIFLLMPVGISWRYAACLALLPMIFYQIEKPKKDNSFWLTVLDVGQALAVVVETKHHRLVYDTGDRTGDSFDSGEMVVVPYLKRQSTGVLDALVISHDDRDHIGGMESVLASVDVRSLYGSRLGLTKSQENILCERGNHWEWDGVQFEFVHPTEGWEGIDNNRSCVLKVSTGEYAVLLTGDIQRKAEKYLLQQEQSSNNSFLQADILLMPHHGSNSSSRTAFIKAVDPSWAIASAGYRSRFRHPDRRVLKRYNKHGVVVLNTAKSGAIQFKIDPDKPISSPVEFRKNDSKFWSRQ